MRFAADVVVMTVDGLHVRLKRGNQFRITNGANDALHHQIAIGPRVILRPFDRFKIILEVIGVLRKIRQVLIRQVHEELLHVLLGQFK